jgi:hypothetical protein
MIQEAPQATPQKVPVDVQVHYLPATQVFRKDYDDETLVATVRTDAMAFFGVQDHTDRDMHEFFLEFEGQRITNTSETLEQLFGRDRRQAKFNLVEQITAGAR